MMLIVNILSDAVLNTRNLLRLQVRIVHVKIEKVSVDDVIQSKKKTLPRTEDLLKN